MLLFERIRNLAFWISDFLHGSPVRSHLQEIQKSFSSSSKTIQDAKLLGILKHAVEYTAFYKHLNPENGIYSFPVINKSIIRESFNDFCAINIEESRRIPVVTSGSTGTPFKVYHDKNKKLRNNADTIYFASRAGFHVGDRLIYMKIFARQKMSSPFQYWKQNIIPIDVIKLNDKQISELLEKMEKCNSRYGFLGYSSAIELVCKYLANNRTGKINAKVGSIISMSESLNDFTKEISEKYLGVRAVSRYSNLENGIIAQEEPDRSGNFLINTASYFVEILNFENNDPAVPGQPGRIVVTDLYNFALPLIRYDTGDIGTLCLDTPPNGKQYFSSIEGRKLDLIYDTNGQLVSSYIVYKNMFQYTEIAQYQLIQETQKQYRFKINSEGEFKRENQLRNEFLEYLGQDAIFNIEYVSEIPLLDSGKRRKIVNLYCK